MIFRIIYFVYSEKKLLPPERLTVFYAYTKYIILFILKKLRNKNLLLLKYPFFIVTYIKEGVLRL
jgi:hypothetical protein